MKPLTLLLRFSALAERINVAVGKTVAWLTLFMVVVTCVVVVFRYAFSSGWIWMQETVTWSHGIVFMLAAAYTLSCDEHVRVDIFYRNASPRRKALVDLALKRLPFGTNRDFHLIFPPLLKNLPR